MQPFVPDLSSGTGKQLWRRLRLPFLEHPSNQYTSLPSGMEKMVFVGSHSIFRYSLEAHFPQSCIPESSQPKSWFVLKHTRSNEKRARQIVVTMTFPVASRVFKCGNFLISCADWLGHIQPLKLKGKKRRDHS